MPVVPPFKTDSYLQYEELSQYLHTLEEAVPHLVKVYSIGASPAGRPLLVAEITNHGTGSASRKASIWIDGNSRGRDLASSAACLAILQRLASEHGRDETITDFVDRYAFYIMPRVCPDEADEYLLDKEYMTMTYNFTNVRAWTLFGSTGNKVIYGAGLMAITIALTVLITLHISSAYRKRKLFA